VLVLPGLTALGLAGYLVYRRRHRAVS